MQRLVLAAIVLIVLASLGARYLGTDDASPRQPAPGPGASPNPRADAGQGRARRRPARQPARAPDGDWQRPDGGRAPGWGEPDSGKDGGARGRGGNEGGGRALRPASPGDPSIRIEIPARVSSSSGTAFSIDSRGLWMTARHVVDSCPKAYILTGARRGMLVKRVYVHPSADIAFVTTDRGAPAFAFAWDTLRVGQTGYHFGFPKGRPGDVKSRLIGRRVMRVHGRYSTAEPIVAWVERVRIPDTYEGLGGISGGPAFDAQGRVIGVTVAGTVRRGRVYTTAAVSMRAALARARIRRGDGQKTGAIPGTGFADFARALRSRLSIAKIVCLVPQRRRSPRRPTY
ncbi:MAG TPA: serine protease [Alphaproteobacteria bacterium]|nr:serine protease [Alphaproteobacteria bacterium]